MILSKNFTLEEMTRSRSASRKGIKNNPTQSEIDNLKRLCETIAQPLRDEVGTIHVNSGYRSPKLNKAIGGSRTSQHRYGEAMDFYVTGYTIPKLCQIIIEMDLPFHQLIDEFSDNGGGWVHVSIAPKGKKPKKQFMTARKGKFGGTKYVNIL